MASTAADRVLVTVEIEGIDHPQYGDEGSTVVSTVAGTKCRVRIPKYMAVFLNLQPVSTFGRSGRGMRNGKQIKLKLKENLTIAGSTGSAGQKYLNFPVPVLIKEVAAANSPNLYYKPNRDSLKNLATLLSVSAGADKILAFVSPDGISYGLE
jgi:hypothetical protein